MIIVAGMLADEPVRILCGRLTAMDCDYVHLDPATFPKGFEIAQRRRGDGSVEGFVRPRGKEAIAFDDISGVYIRHSDYKGAHEFAGLGLPPDQLGLLKAERSLALSHMFDFLPCAVVNRLGNMLSNDSKPVQSHVAHALGFRIPRTLISSAPDEILDFKERCGGKIIYKPVSSVRSVVKLVEREEIERIHLTRNCPVQFQEFIDGKNVRVHVVGDEVFAIRIESKGIDYRYASNRYESVTLDEETVERCKSITRYLGLHMSGIDLIEHDGAHVFLECNPSPAFSYFEIHGFQPISASLVRLLVNGRQAYQDWIAAKPADRSLRPVLPKRPVVATA